MSRPKLQPYPGLRAFERYESRIFFGRQQQVDDLLARLKQHHFLAVLGASGSGKSSLVKAGLLPGLEKGYMGEVGSRWAIAEMRPGDQPFVRLAEGLLADKVFAAAQAIPNAGAVVGAVREPPLPGVSTLAAELRRGSRSLHEILTHAPLPTGTRLLLMVDQFEEMFRFREQEENQAAAFVALLLEACTHPDVYVVITMRSDFLGAAAEFHGLPEAINAGLYLTPRLSREQLRDAISLPAQLFGGSVEDALANHLLNEAGNDPDQLPLLQHALMRLFNKNPQMSLTEYQQMQGLRSTLDRHAERTFEELDSEGQCIAETLFRALTERKDGQDSRRPVKVREVLELAECDLGKLVHVVETFRQSGRNFLMPPSPVPIIPETVLDISHESLIRQWRRLQDWVAAEGDKAAMYLRLLGGAQRYAGGRGELWRGMDLVLAQHWQVDTRPNLGWAKRYSEADHFDLVFGFLYGSAKQQDIEQRKLESLYRQQGELLFDSNLTHASLLTKVEDFAAATSKLESTRTLDTGIPASRRQARDLLAGYITILGGVAQATLQDGDQRLPALTGNAAISTDGRWLAVSGERGTVVLFERASGKLVQKLGGHNAEGKANETTVRDIVFHSTQPLLFSGGDDGQIICWTLPQSGHASKLLQQWQVKDMKVYALALTPDGRVLASGHDDGKIRLWDVEENLSDRFLSGEGKEGTPKLLRVLEGHSQMIDSRGLLFSSDGKRLASASYDNTVRLWDWGKGSSLQVLTGHNDAVHGVAFSPDGQTLASSSADQSIILWDANNGQVLRWLKGHQNMVYGLQFLPDGLLASASSDNTIRLWDVATGITRRILQGHTATVAGLTLWQEQESVLLYSASNDGTVKRWGGELPGQWSVELSGEPTSTAISPDGRIFVVGYADGKINFFNSEDRQLLHELSGEHKRVMRLVFNRDGTLMATAGGEGVVKVWSVHKGNDFPLKLENTLLEHKRAVHAIAFSPDDSQLATACYDGRIGLFDLVGEGKPQLFEAHLSGNGVASVSFGRDRRYLYSGGKHDFEIKLWDLSINPPKLSKIIGKSQDMLLWAGISPDGQKVASVGREYTVSVYPTSGTGTPMRLNGHEQAVFKAIFSPDSRQLATVGGDMTVRLWDLDTQSELFRLHLPHDGSLTVARPSPLWDFDFRCTPTGCWIAVPLTSGKLALYNLGKVEY